MPMWRSGGVQAICTYLELIVHAEHSLWQLAFEYYT